MSQGVGRIAGHLGMNNLIMYYDSNNVQLSTKVDEVDTENVAMKYEAWGWNVITIDGHDVEQIREALTAANAERSVRRLSSAVRSWARVRLRPTDRASRTRFRRTVSR